VLSALEQTLSLKYAANFRKMQKFSYLEELSGKEDSLKENQFCFNQTQDRDAPVP